MMGCGCENKKIMSDYERVAMLAKKSCHAGRMCVRCVQEEGRYLLVR